MHIQISLLNPFGLNFPSWPLSFYLCVARIVAQCAAQLRLTMAQPGPEP
jgi:hypothetical protein